MCEQNSAAQQVDRRGGMTSGMSNSGRGFANAADEHLLKALMTEEQLIAEIFKYHAPTPDQLPRYAAIRQAAKNMAEVLMANCPPSADRTAAIRKIREAMMTGNAAIALNGLSL